MQSFTTISMMVILLVGLVVFGSLVTWVALTASTISDADGESFVAVD